MNPYTDEDDVYSFRDYENRQRQIEADRILADRIQQEELHQQQGLSNSTEYQTSSTATDEELAVCLLANYLHQQEGSTSQSEPEQTFLRAACSSSDVTNRGGLDDVMAHSPLEPTRSQVRLQRTSTSLTNSEMDTAGDQQALEEALSLSLLESQQHEGLQDAVSNQQALDEAIAMSLSTPQASGHTRANDLNENLQYENLLELDDLIGSVGDMRLSSNQLQMLPTHKYKERPHPKSSAVDEREKCAICLTMYEFGSDVKLLPCFHTFHEKCIDEWLQRKAVCPTCNIRVEI